MQLSTIEMPEQEARRRFVEYRRAAREGGTTEDTLIMRGYRELAKGKRLIRLSEAIVAGGFQTLTFETGNRWNAEITRTVPRLAVAKADAERVWTGGIGDFGDAAFVWHRNPRHMSTLNRRDWLEVGGFRTGTGRVQDGIWWSQLRLRAMVPPVPPAQRPGDRLGLYHVLFEAEWAVERPPVPVDPALLRHIGGDLYAVVAVWELTDVERAVLAITR